MNRCVHERAVRLIAAPAGTLEGYFRLTVPEPSTMALLGLGCLGLIRRRR